MFSKWVRVLAKVVVVLVCVVSSSLPLYAARQSASFLVLSDIHFDPYHSCGDARPCELIEQLRLAPSTQWAGILSKYDTQVPKYRDDTNVQLLDAVLASSKQAAQTHQAKFVLILGDFLGHEYRRQYRKFSSDKAMTGYASFVHKTLDFMALKLKSAFPSVSVYSVLGNNDSSQGDYVINAGNAFYQDVSTVFASMIQDQEGQRELKATFPNAGYYAVTVASQPKLRLIVLNTNIFSYKAKGRNLEQVADQELSWLHAQLQAAKADNQKVYIAMHIPEAVDVYLTKRTRLMRLATLWQQKYINQFQADIHQYGSSIAAIFSGHLHADWAHIITVNEKNEIPMYTIASISPFFSNDPSFKLFRYQADDFALESYDSYQFSLPSFLSRAPFQFDAVTIQTLNH